MKACIRTVLVVIAAFALLCCVACSGEKTKEPASSVRLRVVCTFLPIYVITQNVAADVPGVEVLNLLPPTVGCPHNYAMTPGDAIQLESADVLVMNGLGMERFLEGSPYLKRRDLEVIVASEVVEPIPLEFGRERHGQACAEDESLPNPHAWVSPAEAARMTRHIGARLAEIDSEYEAEYRANAEKYAATLDSLAARLAERLKGARNRRIVTFHEAFDYLARDLNLQVVAVVEPDPGVEPSAGKMTELIARIRDTKPAAIFAEPQYSDRLARMLSEETGVPFYVLDPASSGADDPLSYVRIMINNAIVLQQALIKELNP